MTTQVHLPSNTTRKSLQSSFSFEIIPTKDPKKLSLLENHLAKLYEKGFLQYSVVTQEAEETPLFVEYLKKKFTKLEIMPHIALNNSQAASINTTLTFYQKMGIQKILVVRGDPAYISKSPDKLINHTLEPFLNENHNVYSLIQTVIKTGFHCFATCYPEKHPLCKSNEDNMTDAKTKAELGCRALVSQCIYDIHRFDIFRAELKKQECKIPIIPCVMPQHNNAKLFNFAHRNQISLPKDLLQSTKEEKLIFYKAFLNKLLALDESQIPYISLSTVNTLWDLLAP